MKKYIVANWKCNPATLKEAENIFGLIKKEVKIPEVIICPPFTYLSSLKGLALGAQNVFFESKGAYTGEISPLMLKDLGCKYVLIGHSERRKYFNETDEIINKKIKAAIGAGLSPIFCIGETEKERKEGKAEEVIERQIKKGLEGVKAPIIIAYEPVWAIGTGNSCGKEEAEKMSLFIKKMADVPVLYGGSVNASNSKEYAKMDGLLVGGASLIPDEFITIVKNAV